MERFPNADERINDQERIVPLIAGVGAAGIGAVNAIIRSGMPYADFAAIDTDRRRLKNSLAARTVHILPECAADKAGATGWTAFADALFAQGARQGFCGIRWLIIITDMADEINALHTPILTQAAKDHGWCVFGIVTAPVHKNLISAGVIEYFRNHMDALLVFPFDRSGEQSFAQADTLLLRAVKGIAEPFAYMNLISFDVADLTAVFRKTDVTGMGTGTARGESRARKAAKQALASLRNPYSYHSVFANITGWNMSVDELCDISGIIQAACHTDACVSAVDCHMESMGEALRVTIFNNKQARS